MRLSSVVGDLLKPDDAVDVVDVVALCVCVCVSARARARVCVLFHATSFGIFGADVRAPALRNPHPRSAVFPKTN